MCTHAPTSLHPQEEQRRAELELREEVRELLRERAEQAEAERRTPPADTVPADTDTDTAQQQGTQDDAQAEGKLPRRPSNEALALQPQRAETELPVAGAQKPALLQAQQRARVETLMRLRAA
jgi:hypothetical protein